MKGVRIWLVGSIVAALFAAGALVVVQVSRSSPPPPASAVPPPTPITSVVLADPVQPPAVSPPPSEKSVKERATSGDRARATAAKNGLKAKAARGEASMSEQRMLRALCRQLGDMTCVN